MKSGKAIARMRAILLEVFSRKTAWDSSELTTQVENVYKLVLHEVLTENEEEVD